VKQVLQFQHYQYNKWHLPNKSDVITLGLLDEDERQSKDMRTIKLLNERYVPYSSIEVDGKIAQTLLVKLTLTGDHLTKQNANAVIGHLKNAVEPMDKVEGLLPAVANFNCAIHFTNPVYREFY
jgi:hypothetical protein